jgi:MarR family transcriptional regulator for hemolysin
MKSMEEQFAESVHMLAHSWRTELDRRLRPLGYSHSRWLLLLHLSRNDGCTHQQLAQHMGIEAPTLVKLVDHLEKEGLLKRCVSETDRRVKHLNLSDAGKQVVVDIRSNAAELRKDILSDTSKEELQITYAVLQRIREKLALLP